MTNPRSWNIEDVLKEMPPDCTVGVLKIGGDTWYIPRQNRTGDEHGYTTICVNKDGHTFFYTEASRALLVDSGSISFPTNMRLNVGLVIKED